MKRLTLIFFLLAATTLSTSAQPSASAQKLSPPPQGTAKAAARATGNAMLAKYIEAARKHSPLIADCRNRQQIDRAELKRLEAFYTHSRLEASGDYLFVPVISHDNGRTAFKWNAQSDDDYYGYDLGESSGHLHAGVTWTKPLLGGSALKVAGEQARINRQMADNDIGLEEHQLERTVTELYLLCLLDKAQIDFADTIAAIIDRQTAVMRRLAAGGLARQTDIKLLRIEREAWDAQKTAGRQSYRAHLMDLNLLCGIDDTTTRLLPEISIATALPALPAPGSGSRFDEKFRLDSLNETAALKAFNLQYKPRLDLFVNAGMQTGAFAGWYRHFGWSAGLTFAVTLSDGRQRQWKERQTRLRLQTIAAYRDHAALQRRLRIAQSLGEIKKYDEREQALRRQLADYDEVMKDYSRVIAAGQMSTLDYITLLRNRCQTEKDLLLLITNRQLAVAALNYWNW